MLGCREYFLSSHPPAAVPGAKPDFSLEALMEVRRRVNFGLEALLWHVHAVKGRAIGGCGFPT